MRSRRNKTAWAVLALLLVAAAGAAWWTRGLWEPHALPWARQAWQQLTRPGADTLPRNAAGERTTPTAGAAGAAGGTSAPLSQARKCVDGGRVTYTDQPCPAGSREQALDGALTSLPAAPR